MEGKKGSKFNYEEISLKNDNSRPFTETISLINSKKLCLCNNYNELKAFECFKCKAKVHYCVKVQINRPQIHSFECLSCLARAMDLVYQPQTILLETFYKTQNIFERSNIIHFEFDLRYEDTKFPVDVRGLKGSKIELVWPMQGEFSINGFKENANVLKPLKQNSNRKNRKEETFLIEPKFLREGKNVLTFKIPRLDKNLTLQKYKYEETGFYFLAIYSVKELKNNEVLNITQKERRFEKVQMIQLFNQGDQDVPAEKQKVRLIDPYTGERIKFPVRGRYCTHLSTVCLLSYVSFQRNARSWKCPICSIQSNSFLNEPYLDIWMHEILQDNLKGENVFIHPNGTYEWEELKQVAEVIDSDEDDLDRNDKKLDPIAQEEQAAIAEFQIFDIDSYYQQSSQPQEIDLIDFDEVGQIYQPQNDLWNHRQVQNSDGELIGPSGDLVHQQDGDLNFDTICEPIIEEFVEIHEPESEQNSEFEFPFNNNDFVPSSKLQNIKILPSPIEAEKKDLEKTPQIYKIPLDIKPKKTSKKPQSNVPQDFTPDMIKKMNLLREKLLEKAGQKPQQRHLPNQPQKTQTQQQQIKLQGFGKDKFIGDKRLIQRPTFIQTVEQRSQQPNFRASAESLKRQNLFGKVQKKNIEWSQERVNKSEPKIQYGLGKIFPLPQQMQKTQQKQNDQKIQKPLQKIIKKEEPVQQKPKKPSIKTIKCMNCPPISYSKFVKEYCRIPIPIIFKRMNEDLRNIFAPIL